MVLRTTRAPGLCRKRRDLCRDRGTRVARGEMTLRIRQPFENSERSHWFRRVRLHSADSYHLHTALDISLNYTHNVVLIVIGEFEYLILSAAAHLGEDAYGAAMRVVIETTGGRTCSLGALYTTLDRLEAKGLVETWMSEPTQQRGGRAKRMVRVTGKGIRAARDFYDAVVRISRGTEWGESRRVRLPGDAK